MKSPIVKTASRALTPFILLYGAYVTLFGVLSPGGGFPGGIIMASGVILILVSHGSDEVKRLVENIEWFDTFGAFAFLLVGLAGLFIGGAYFANLWPRSPNMLILLDIVVALKVFAGTIALFVYFLKLEVKPSSTE